MQLTACNTKRKLLSLFLGKFISFRMNSSWIRLIGSDVGKVDFNVVLWLSSPPINTVGATTEKNKQTKCPVSCEKRIVSVKITSPASHKHQVIHELLSILLVLLLLFLLSFSLYFSCLPFSCCSRQRDTCSAKRDAGQARLIERYVYRSLTWDQRFHPFFASFRRADFTRTERKKKRWHLNCIYFTSHRLLMLSIQLVFYSQVFPVA